MARAGARVRPRGLDRTRRAGRWTSCARRCGCDGRLLATYKDGRAHLNAYLDDHAFLLAALLESMQADFRSDDLEFASTLADALLARFEDRAAGGFFFTSRDHETLILGPSRAGQRHAVGQRGRGAGACSASGTWSESRAIWMRRSARCACSFRRCSSMPARSRRCAWRLAEHSSRRRPWSCAASAPGCAPWQARACTPLCAVDAGARALPPACGLAAKRWTSLCAQVSTRGFAGALSACRRSTIRPSWSARCDWRRGKFPKPRESL